MFSFVQLFIIYAFLLLVPFGYLVEHWRYAVSLKLVGWIFRLYLLVPILGLVYTGYVASGRYWGSASWPGTDLIEVSTIWFLIFLVHIPLSIPGGIALAVIRFFAQAANEGKDEPEETLSSR